MEQSIDSGDVSIRGLAGLNQRTSPLDLQPNEFSVLRGYYPSQQGLLSRLPGKEFIFQLSGTILTIHPTYNSEGHVLIQTTEQLYLTTVNEIQGRTFNTDLTANIIPDPDTDAGTAYQIIFYGKKAAGINGDQTSIRTLTDLVIPDGFQNFIIGWDSSGVTLPAGSYVIESICTLYSVDTSLNFYHNLLFTVGASAVGSTYSETVKNSGGGNIVTKFTGNLICSTASKLQLFTSFNSSAIQTLTGTGNPSNNQTMTVGAKVYTMKTTLVAGEGNVKIGTNLSDTFQNIFDALNAVASSYGIRHNCAVINPSCNSTLLSSAGVNTSITLTALAAGAAGNGIATTETLSNMAFGGTTTSGGRGPTLEGLASNLGEDEIYTILKISKLA